MGHESCSINNMLNCMPCIVNIGSTPPLELFEVEHGMVFVLNGMLKLMVDAKIHYYCLCILVLEEVWCRSPSTAVKKQEMYIIIKLKILTKNGS